MDIGRRAIRHRWAILLASAGVLAFFGYGAALLEGSVDPHDYFSEDDPAYLELKRLEDTYSGEFNVLFVLEPLNGDVFTRETLEAAAWLTEKGWLVPTSARVDSLTNYQHTTAEEDDLLVEDLVGDPASLSGAEIEKIKGIALSEPALLERVVSRSGHVTAVNVSLVRQEETLDEEIKTAAHVRALAAEFEGKFPGIRLHLTGVLMWNAAFRETAQAELKKLLPLMLTVMALFIYFFLRSAVATAATLLVVVASALTGMGAAGWLGIALNDATAAAPTIIMTLAVADSIHILTTMFQEIREGRSRDEAIAESLRINLQPVILTSVTTAVGFLSLNFSDAPPFHDLGNVVAVGVMAALGFSVVLLPAFMSFFSLETRGSSQKAARSCQDLAELVIRRPRLIFWSMGALILLLGAGMSRIEFDDNFIEYMDETVKFRRDADFTEKNLMGLDTIEYSFETGEEGGVSDPAYLAKLSEFEDWLRKNPSVRHVSSINDIMKKLNKTLHGDDPAWYRVPDSRELAAQYLLLYEMSLPFGLDLTTSVNLDKSGSRFIVYLEDMTSMEMIGIEKEAARWLRENAPEGLRPNASGLSVRFAHITKNNIKSMLTGTFLALVLISAILIAALKSWKIGLVSLVPNLAPAVMAFGLWGLTMRRVGLAVSVVAALTLGIVVDDTVHFLSKYLRARREHGMSPADAVRYSFEHVGLAMLFTSVILIAGFLILGTSHFRVNMVMGLLSAAAIAFALMTDFLFLPPLLLRLEGAPDESPDAHGVDRNPILDGSGGVA